jgi:hypothetical protein
LEVFSTRPGDSDASLTTAAVHESYRVETSKRYDSNVALSCRIVSSALSCSVSKRGCGQILTHRFQQLRLSEVGSLRESTSPPHSHIEPVERLTECRATGRSAGPRTRRTRGISISSSSRPRQVVFFRTLRHGGTTCRGGVSRRLERFEEYRETARRAGRIAFSVTRRICDFGRAFVPWNHGTNA